MKRYEKAALVLMAAGLLLVSAAEVALFLAPVAAALLVGAIAVAKRGWEKDTGKKAVLFFDLSAKKDPTE